MSYRYLILLLFNIWASSYAFAQAQDTTLWRQAMEEEEAQLSALRNSNPAQSQVHARKALELAQRLKDRDSEAFYWTHIGVSYKNMGQYEEALLAYHTALGIQEEVGSVQGQAGNYNNIASVYKLQGKGKQAVEYYLRALDAFRRLEQPKQVSIVLINLGGFYSEQGNYERALNYFKEGLDFARAQKDSLNEAYALNNLGEVYLKQGELERAGQHFVQAMQIKRVLNANRPLVTGLANMGKYFMAKTNYDSAKVYFDQALALSQQAQDLYQEARVWLELGELYYIQNRQDLAAQAYEQSLELSQRIGSKPNYEKAYQHLAKHYARIGQYEKAYVYGELYQNLRDSLRSFEGQRQINELQAFYDDTYDRYRIEILERENAVKTLQNERQTILQGVLWGFVLLLLMMLFMLYRKHQLKRMHASELEHKNTLIAEALAHREMLIKEIHHRVKNNLQIVSSLLNLQTRGLETEQTEVRTILMQSKDRIQAMSVLHELLYKSHDLQSIDAKTYIEELLSYFRQFYVKDGMKLEIEADLDSKIADIDFLIPLGLIINELLTNSLKYAFTPEHAQPRIKVFLRQEAEGFRVGVMDNGKGLPPHFSINSAKGLGMRLVQGLSRQIKAQLSHSQLGGTTFELYFAEEAQNKLNHDVAA